MNKFENQEEEKNPLEDDKSPHMNVVQREETLGDIKKSNSESSIEDGPQGPKDKMEKKIAEVIQYTSIRESMMA
jgi:hypothetical protein